MENCYARQQRQQRQNNPDHIDKDIRLCRTIGVNLAVSKSSQKIGLDTELQGKITSVREEKYKNNIPAILDLVSEGTQTI